MCVIFSELRQIGYTLSVTQGANLLWLYHLSQYGSTTYWLTTYYPILPFMVQVLV
jgi:hypothetical protein